MKQTANFALLGAAGAAASSSANRQPNGDNQYLTLVYNHCILRANEEVQHGNSNGEYSISGWPVEGY